MEMAVFLKRRSLWVGFLAVLVPLLVLLWLQYRWLVQLDQASAIAQKATLNNYLEAVVSDVETTYRQNAERVLNLSPNYFTQDRLEKAAYHFKKKGVEGAKRLFVVSFADGPDGDLLYFEPSCASFSPPTRSPEAQAVWLATAPWRALVHKGVPVERVRLTIDERDLDYRIVLNPITDDTSKVVGLAGMILDEEHFRRSVLPAAIQKSLPKFFAGNRQGEPVVSVEDGLGETAYATGKADKDNGRLRETEAARPFAFVFTDWKIGLISRHTTPAVVARRNFLVNIALSAVLGTVLLSGVVLALRTASRAMKLSQMKNDFVSNVSHELRTPLASIRVFGEFLRLGRVDSPEKAREYGDYIETESRRLTQLINNILDFASIESGRKSYRFERSDVSEVVCDTLKTFEIRLRQSGFRILLERSEGPLPPARIDAGAIAQSLSNLLDNAVKYSGEKKDITVTLRRDGDSIVIAVKDQGIGIPRDEQKKIFDRFHRVGTGLVHDVKGSGLGLSIVRHIVEAHRGTVTVASRPGEGSTFSIHLPIEQADSRAAAAAAPFEAPAGAAVRGLRS
jgi:signal transduction histidine kinase